MKARVRMIPAIGQLLASWITGAVMLPMPVHAQDVPFLGKVVVPKRASITVMDGDAQRVQSPGEFGYKVVDEKQGLLKLRSHTEGEIWVRTTEFILLEHAEDYFTALVKKDPKDVNALNWRANTRVMNGKLDEAMKDYDQSLRLESNAVTFFYRANLLVQMREYDKAIADQNEAIRLKPGWAAALVARGDSYCRKGSYREGIDDYDSALKLNPKDQLALTYRGWALYKTRDFDGAMESLDAAITLNPRLGYAFHFRGFVWVGRRDYSKASADLAKAADLEPDNVRCQYSYAWLMATCPEGRHRDGKKAVEVAQRAYKLQKNRATLETLAAAHAEAGDFDAAVRYQEEASGFLPRVKSTRSAAKG